MNLHTLLAARAASDRPVTVGLIGAGKFGSMFLNQLPTTPGLELAWIADLAPDRAREALRRVGWSEVDVAAVRIDDDAKSLIAERTAEVVIDATGSPPAGVAHARAAIAAGSHIVMVNVEADALCGPLLAKEAADAGVVYSLAYGDQPALVCELVDWARAAGFEVIAGGKGTKYLPGYHEITPDEVWGEYGITPEDARAGGMNSQMFNSFMDGTKSAIEMTAIANATGLGAPSAGLSFAPCGVHDLARVLRPRQEGGMLEFPGQVDVISSHERDGRPVVGDLRWGVYVVFAAPNDYARRCFKEYGLITDPSGNYAAMWKPFHLIGLELGISVLSAALRKEATGAATGWRADVASVAKRDLKAGDTLDGEGGYTVWGKCQPAAESARIGALPIGLAHKVRMARDVARGATVTMADVALDEASEVVRARRAMETAFAPTRAG